LKKVWEFLCGTTARRSKTIVHTTSLEEEAAVAARLPGLPTALVPNGVDLPEAPHGRVWKPDGTLRLIFLGRISPKKGLENLFLALSQIDSSDTSLTVYGAGEDAYVSQLRALIPARWRERVKFLGHVEGDEKRDAFLSADVCVVPSHSENYCMVVAESLSYGVPVIASKGTPWRRLETMKCGLWVNNDANSLADAISRIRYMPLEQMGVAGRSWMANEYAWSRVATAMREVYAALIHRR
jgi:glycosyltransferase involved in cell wall biosynthesis